MVKTKKVQRKGLLYIVIGSIAILVSVSLLFLLNSSQVLRLVGVSKSVPVFTFTDSKAPGWWAAENYNSQASMSTEEDYQGSEPIDKLSVASMNVFKGKKGDNATACFVMFTYYDYSTDVAKLKATSDTELSKDGSGYKYVGDMQSTINTPDGVKSYTLAKYELSGPGTENSMKGTSYGWIKLNQGHIQVSGVCPTAAELDDTAQISEAISLVKP
ncbi:MAG: hypothetical protein WAQ27_01045 [Candidatus Microsaccharimonas sp.]